MSGASHKIVVNMILISKCKSGAVSTMGSTWTVAEGGQVVVIWCVVVSRCVFIGTRTVSLTSAVA